jgi:hypothetical protein
MPAHLFEFASNPENHDLRSRNSLHDCWLEYWRIAETPRQERVQNIQIESCFLGAYHDRRIYLTYGNVHGYRMKGPDHLPPSPRHESHGDLLVHELTMEREGLFTHEMQFSSGAVFAATFEDLDHRVELIEPRNGSP